MTKFDYEGFLTEYEALVTKYGIIIDGCGCCGSPYVCSLKDRVNQFGEVFSSVEQQRRENLEHLRSTVGVPDE